MIGRREFTTLLGGAAAAWPFAARAQQGDRLRRVGVLMSYAKSDPDGGAFVAAFREGLQQLGWLESRDIRIDDRWAALDAEALQRFAKELIALQPDLILSQTTNSTAALLQQSRTVPIIFANVADPVGSGFVASLARPGGSVTGFVLSEPTMAGKWLELLKEIAPRIKRAALLFNPATAPFAEYFVEPFKAAALSSGVEAIKAKEWTAEEREVRRQIQPRNRHRCSRARARQWPDCNSGCLPERPSGGGDVVGGALPAPYRLSLPFLPGARWPAILWK